MALTENYANARYTWFSKSRLLRSKSVHWFAAKKKNIKERMVAWRSHACWCYIMQSMTPPPELSLYLAISLALGHRRCNFRQSSFQTGSRKVQISYHERIRLHLWTYALRDCHSHEWAPICLWFRAFVCGFLSLSENGSRNHAGYTRHKRQWIAEEEYTTSVLSKSVPPVSP